MEQVGKEIGVHLGHLWGGWGTPEEGHLNEHGVPAMCLWKADDPNYHSDNEHVDNIDWNGVKAVAQVIGVASWRVANDTGIIFPAEASNAGIRYPGRNSHTDGYLCLSVRVWTLSGVRRLMS